MIQELWPVLVLPIAAYLNGVGASEITNFLKQRFPGITGQAAFLVNILANFIIVLTGLLVTEWVNPDVITADPQTAIVTLIGAFVAVYFGDKHYQSWLGGGR